MNIEENVLSIEDMKKMPDLVDAALGLVEEMFSLNGEGHFAERIADAIDDVAYLFVEANASMKGHDATINTLHYLYEHAKKIDEAAVDIIAKYPIKINVAGGNKNGKQ